MAVSVQTDAVLDLGRKLVGELGLDDTVDTLGRWMAHYIAELMSDAENAPPADKAAKQERCMSAILDLWHHRAQLPNGKRPFEEVEPILHALESLDPCDETPRHFRQPRMMAQANPDPSAQKWLEIADGVDSTAKELIRHCLARAAQTAEDKTKEWVVLAEKARIDNDIDIRVLRGLGKNVAPSNAGETDDAERKQLERFIERLESFKKLARGLAEDLRGKLTAGD